MKARLYLAVAFAAMAVGYAIYYFLAAPRVAMEPTAGPVEQQPLAGQSAAAETSLPAVLPDFTLGDLSGAPRSIRSWPGKSMIVNFWATWCAPCRREIPLLRELQKQHGPEGFQIVGVAVDIREDVVKYAQEIGIDYPVLIGEQDGLDAVNSFGQGSLGFPFTVFTDNQGRIVLFHLGEIHREQADVMLAAVREVNSGKLTPEAARVVVAKQLAEMPPKPSAG
ncbi:MAG TPA: TlpA disulfide reductase family protein [Steroidobacteraceae bacterium]|nr:TlpA disulfide reductase family protein [Steroidobacteraceae bacterium]